MDAAKAALQADLIREQPAFKDIEVTISHGGKVANLVLNREKSLNSLTQYGSYPELAKALRYIDTLPIVVFTRITGKGRFFSAGQDLKDITEGRKKMSNRYDAQEEQGRMLWSGPGGASMALVEHTKVVIMGKLFWDFCKHHLVVMANVRVSCRVRAHPELNGPAIGWPSCWIAAGDILLAAESCYIYMPFIHLGAMLEASASMAWQWKIGAGFTLDMALTGRKVTAKELYTVGGVQRLWPDATFREEAAKFLEEMVERCNHDTQLEAKFLIRWVPKHTAMRLVISLFNSTIWVSATSI